MALALKSMSEKKSDGLGTVPAEAGGEGLALSIRNKSASSEVLVFGYDEVRRIASGEMVGLLMVPEVRAHLIGVESKVLLLDMA